MIEDIFISPFNSLPAGTLITIAVVIVLHLLRLRLQSHVKAPVVGTLKADDCRSAILEGWEKFRDSVYQLQLHHHKTTILPRKYIDEIKSLPENKVSFQKDVDVRFQGKYTLFSLRDDDILIDVVKNDLTRGLVSMLDDLQDEAKYIVKTELGECEDWVAKTMYPTMLRMVALISGRVFVGTPLSRTEEWITTSINYTTDTVIGSAQLVRYPRWIRPVAARFIPMIQRCRAHIDLGLKLIGPVVKSRLAHENDPDYQKPNDVIQWHLDRSKPELRHDLDYQTQSQLKLSFAAIHTTSQATTHVLFELAYRPEYIKELRQELEEVLIECDGTLTKQSITKLHKLDSFLKETQRLNPPNLIGLQRKIISDVKFKDGTILPAGSYSGTDIWNLVSSKEVWGENAEEFDGYRFEKLRSQPGNEHKYQFVTTSLDSQTFGLGTHACPGRFFASNEMKILISRIISDYDLKLEDGATRPVNRFNNAQNIPSPTAKVLFRKRAT